MKHTFYQLCVVLVLISFTVPAQALTSLMEAARTHSLDARILELQREQAQTELSLMDFVPSPSLTVSGDATAGTAERSRTTFEIDPAGDLIEDVQEWTIFSVTGSPVISYNLHGDAKTEIRVGLDEVFYSHRTDDRSDYSWRVSPFIQVTQPLTHFIDKDDALEDIEYSLAYLRSELSYRQGMIGIDKQVLSVVEQIISFDKQLADAHFELARLIKDHERSLEIGTYSKESARSRSARQQIDSLERSIQSLERNRKFAVDELEFASGMQIEDAPDIPEPEPELTASPLGNTAVLIQAMQADKAREELKEFVDDHWELEIYGGYGAAFDHDNTTPGHRVEAGLSGSYRDLMLSAGITADFADKNTIRGRIEGSWSVFDGRNVEENLMRRRLEKELDIAEQNRDREEQAYQRKNSQLEIELTAWERDIQQLELRMSHAQQDLEEAEAALEKGIGSQRKVDEARNRLEQLEYDEKLLWIDGWQLQRSIQEHLL